MTNFEALCHKLNERIRLRADGQAMLLATAVLDYMTTKMKDFDPAFRSMYKGHKIAGSYADDLKISEPNEFDFVLSIKLPNIKDYRVNGWIRNALCFAALEY